jgi:hypothetical protein
LKISRLAFSGFKKKICGLAISRPLKKLVMPTSDISIPAFTAPKHKKNQLNKLAYLLHIISRIFLPLHDATKKIIFVVVAQRGCGG